MSQRVRVQSARSHDRALLRRAYGELAATETGRTLRRKNLVIDLERASGFRRGIRSVEKFMFASLAP